MTITRGRGSRHRHGNPSRSSPPRDRQDYTSTLSHRPRADHRAEAARRTEGLHVTGGAVHDAKRAFAPVRQVRSY
eukprot:361698-Chlamydomonas_euryale.AAC.3